MTKRTVVPYRFIHGLADLSCASPIPRVVVAQLNISPETTSRRALLGRVAAAAPALAALPAFAGPLDGLQDGKRTNENGATGGQGFSLVSSSGAPNQSGRKGGTIPKIRASGVWADPAHPGCTRKIVLQGNTAIITGADEDGKAWKVKGIVDGTTINVDFTPKGGPAGVEAKFVVGKGIVFPDGNVWTKA